MSITARKRLGTVLLIVSLLLAAVAVKMHQDLKRQIDEQARNVGLAAEGHPMGGRAASGWEDPRARRWVYTTSAVAAFTSFFLAVLCFAQPRSPSGSPGSPPA